MTIEICKHCYDEMYKTEMMAAVALKYLVEVSQEKKTNYFGMVRDSGDTPAFRYLENVGLITTTESEDGTFLMRCNFSYFLYNDQLCLKRMEHAEKMH